MDGLDAAIRKMDWRNDAAKYIFHICDAAPHGSEYVDPKYDAYPHGCPCGITIKDISAQLKKNNINYKLLKLNYHTNKMAKIFKSYMGSSFEEMRINDASQLVSKVTSVIVRDIKTQEIDVVVE